jgi:hypothetical protein
MELKKNGDQSWPDLRIKMTIVNGEILVEDSEHTGVFPGRVLGNRKIANGCLSS